MKDMVIDACRWYIDESSEDAIKRKVAEEFKNRYIPLLRFFAESGLTRKKNLASVENNWLDFEIKMSDFTDEGLELLMLCHDKWLDSIARGSNPKNIALWERQLNRLREEDPILLH